MYPKNNHKQPKHQDTLFPRFDRASKYLAQYYIAEAAAQLIAFSDLVYTATIALTSL